MSQPYRLERRQWIPRAAEEVFEFFADARNLEKMTPEWLTFRIVTPGPIEMRTGALIEYRLAWRFIALHWKTLIALWDRPRCFIDEQTSGPYKRWRHTHGFEEDNGGTYMYDIVEYELPLGILGRLAHTLRVRRDLERIFDYRAEAIRRRFGT